MKRGKTYDWIPLYVDKWLFGSTRLELEHDERAIWSDFLALSAKDEGYIRANENTPYPLQQLAGMLCCDLELLERTIAKASSKEVEKLKVFDNGIMYVINWEEYRLSPRHKRRFESEKKSDVPNGGHDDQKGGHYTEKDTDTETDTETEKKEVAPEERTEPFSPVQWAEVKQFFEQEYELFLKSYRQLHKENRVAKIKEGKIKFLAICKRGKYPRFKIAAQNYADYLAYQKNEQNFDQMPMQSSTFINNWEEWEKKTGYAEPKL